MTVKKRAEAQNPLILRCNRLIEAFAKSDDERDFYLDRLEGFLVYVDLDKSEEELSVLEAELGKNIDRYCMIPKLTFYETKKIMEGFVNEKVYDIDTKEKLLDIIQSKEARENFLDFIYDHHSELEKWQTYYQERSRIRIIEWLRNSHFHFVFEEDLELPKMIIEKLKRELFQIKAGKEILAARKNLVAKAKTYYSNEALNPRPKRGRPPKQAQKAEVEQQVSTDIYITVPSGLRGFLFTPDLTSPSAATFSSKFGNEEELFSNRRVGSLSDADISQETLDQKLIALRKLSSKWVEPDNVKGKAPALKKAGDISFADGFDDDEDEDEDEDEDVRPSRHKPKNLNGSKVSTAKRSPAQVLKPVSKPSSNTSRGKGAPILSKKVPIKATIPNSKAKPPAKTAPKAAAAVSRKAPPKKVPAAKSANGPSAPPKKTPPKPPVKAPSKKPAVISRKAPPKVAPKATLKAPSKPAPNFSKKKVLRPINKLKKKK